VYETGLGRFCQRDPLGYADGYGLQGAYFVPSGVDPEGLMDSSWVLTQDTPACRPTSSWWPKRRPKFARAVSTDRTFDVYWPSRAANPEQIVERIREQHDELCDCINKLELVGHGGKGDWGITGREPGKTWEESADVRTGDIAHVNSIDSTNAFAFGKYIRDRVCLCDECEIVLAACGQGQHCWPQFVADATGCTVIAPKGISITRAKYPGLWKEMSDGYKEMEEHNIRRYRPGESCKQDEVSPPTPPTIRITPDGPRIPTSSFRLRGTGRR